MSNNIFQQRLFGQQHGVQGLWAKVGENDCGAKAKVNKQSKPGFLS